MLSDQAVVHRRDQEETRDGGVRYRRSTVTQNDDVDPRANLLDDLVGDVVEGTRQPIGCVVVTVREEESVDGRRAKTFDAGLFVDVADLLEFVDAQYR